MSDMAKYPFLTQRSGSQNWYYKRDVPPELRAPGRSKQIWKSLKTPDRNKAQRAYAAQHAEVELLFAEWRSADNRPVAKVDIDKVAPSASDLPYTPLTPALLRKLADDHYLDIYDNDFAWRGSLWLKASTEEEAFWHGDIIKHPANDWQKHKGQSYSYYALLMEEPDLEEVFLYSVYTARKENVRALTRLYQLGDTRNLEPSADDLLKLHQISLCDSDRNRLLRKLMQTEIKALEDLTAGDEATFDSIIASQRSAAQPSERKPPAQPAELASELVEKYIEITSREREWPIKTELRKRSELREFLEICGDKPINAYGQQDGVKFKDTESELPLYRQKALFKGLSLIEAAKKAAKLRNQGQDVEFLSPLTINDKIGTVSLFFNWAKTRTAGVVNPVADQAIRRRKNKREGKKVHPWTIEELNRMFAAPLYVGCESERYWKQPGQSILHRSAKFWVPLVSLFPACAWAKSSNCKLQTSKRKMEFFSSTSHRSPLTLTTKKASMPTKRNHSRHHPVNVPSRYIKCSSNLVLKSSLNFGAHRDRRVSFLNLKRPRMMALGQNSFRNTSSGFVTRLMSSGAV